MIKIALLGDVALFGKFSSRSKTDLKAYFSPVIEHLATYDYVIGNLETPFVEDARPNGAKSAYISAAPEDVATLKMLGINIVNLANNHIYDYGAAGYECTIKTLLKAGIDYFGSDNKQIFLSGSGSKVVLNGYCSFNTNPLGVSSKGAGRINALNFPQVTRRLRENAEQGWLNILSIHSGNEHVNYPSRDDIKMARKLSEVSPYVYYGHHPHVIQGSELIGDSLIAYSLGNFCFDDVYTNKSTQPLIRQTENNKSGMILGLEVEGDAVKNYNFTPIFLGDGEMQVGSNKISSDFSQYSEALKADADWLDALRSKIIADYVQGRRGLRDMRWYLKRLNFSSLEIIVRSKLNQRAYRKSVSRHL